MSTPSPEVGRPSVSAADAGHLLERLYHRRFSPSDKAEMRAVWRVLVREFFQSRIRPEATVVDVGAGSCHFINEVRAARRIAVDANPDLINHVAPGVEAIVSDDLSLRELTDGSVGHVFLSNLLEHLSDFREALALLVTVFQKLEPGGTVLVLQPNFRLIGARYFDFLDHQLILTERSLVEALEVAGFEVRELRVRFLPYTSKSRLSLAPWLVSLYLRLRPAQWLLGGQTFAVGVKPRA